MNREKGGVMSRLKGFIFCLIAVVAFFVINGCGKTKESVYNFNYDSDIVLEEAPYPEWDILIISDLHFYDKSLGITGEAFENYLSEDRKLLAESEEILQVAIEQIIEAQPDALLIPGDLTKDGELICHKKVVTYLQQVEDAGISVYVVPGNHDIDNPDAVSYKGDKETRVETITSSDFTSIYNEFGFKEALFRDVSSLSYVVEPTEGLWLFCMDTTITETNYDDNYPMTDGAHEPATLEWMEDLLIKANQKGKAVAIMHHHAVVPHWDGQEKLHNEYIVEGYKSLQEFYAYYNAKFVFTGHYHSQDIAKAPLEESEGSPFVYDIETGSLLTYPCPIRSVKFSPKELLSSSYFITAIPSIPEGFSEYAAKYVYDGVVTLAKEVIEELPVSVEATDYLCDKIGRAYQAHYAGDEQMTGEEDSFKKKGLGLFGRIVAANQGYVLKGLWHDTDGSDNSIAIDTETGEWE